MNRLALLLCVSFVGFSQAAPPASSPSTAPSESYPAMRARLQLLEDSLAISRREAKELHDQVLALKMEIDDLRAKAADAKAKEATPPEDADAMKRVLVEKIRIGQSLQEVRSLLGQPADTTRSGSRLIRDFVSYKNAITDKGAVVNYETKYIVHAVFDDNEKLVDIYDTSEAGLLGR